MREKTIGKKAGQIKIKQYEFCDKKRNLGKVVESKSKTGVHEDQAVAVKGRRWQLKKGIENERDRATNKL